MISTSSVSRGAGGERASVPGDVVVAEREPQKLGERRLAVVALVAEVHVGLLRIVARIQVRPHHQPGLAHEFVF